MGLRSCDGELCSPGSGERESCRHNCLRSLVSYEPPASNVDAADGIAHARSLTRVERIADSHRRALGPARSCGAVVSRGDAPLSVKLAPIEGERSNP